MTRKNLFIVIGITAVIVIGYVGWRWWQARQSGNSPTASFGTNLNSVAPEMVGGSSGPAVAPAVNTPINITVTESTAAPPEMNGANEMQGVNARTPNNPMTRQADSVIPGVVSPGDNSAGMTPDMNDTAYDMESGNAG